MRVFPTLFQSAIKRAIWLGLSILLLLNITPAQAAPKVAVSIAPIHSLVAGIMDGVAKPYLLVTSNQSPHNTNLAPSVLKTIHAADLIVWVGSTLETSLNKPLKQIDQAKKITLLETAEIEKLPTRVGGNFDAHNHDHDEHTEDELDMHALDPHIWLSPHNAAAIVQTVSTWLIQNDPDHAEQYANNTTILLMRINTLHHTLEQQLDVIQSQQWIVFHDAYQYFEHAFELAPFAAVTLNPERKPGAKRLQNLRRQIINNNVRCLFIEPQFKPSAANIIAENTNAQIAVLDPLGAKITPSKEHWFLLLEQLANNLVECLTEN